MTRDIVVTWPKNRPLDSYLDELARAVEEGLVINYRVGRPPKWGLDAWTGRQPRCYIVYDGQVRGYNDIISAERRRAGQVRAVGGGYWPEGWYLVRDPEWHSIDPIAMRGFQGWHWFNEEEERCTKAPRSPIPAS